MLDRNIEISILCPQCENKFKESLGRLETSPVIPCPACAAPIQIKAEELTRGLEEFQRLIQKFKPNIAKTNT